MPSIQAFTGKCLKNHGWDTGVDALEVGVVQLTNVGRGRGLTFSVQRTRIAYCGNGDTKIE